MTSKSARPILRYSSVVNMKKVNFTNFENSYKLNENSYDDYFFSQWWLVEKGNSYYQKTILGVNVT